MDAKKIIKGDDLMLFVKVNNTYKSIAYATSHTLTLTAETQDINSKDHGLYGATSVNKISWEIQSENLFTVEDYDTLFDLMIAREPIDVVFGKKNEADTVIVADGDAANYTPKAYTAASGTEGQPGYVPAYTHRKEGKAIITSLTENTPSGDNATFSVTLAGVGAIKRITSAS